MPAGIEEALAVEIKRYSYDQVQELWHELTLSWIARDPEERAHRIEEASMAELKRDPSDEMVSPLGKLLYGRLPELNR